MREAPSTPSRTGRVFRGCLISLVVGLVALILLGTWLNHEITRSISGEFSVEEHQRAQERFAGEPGVVGTYHDWLGEVTIRLTSSSEPEVEYAEIAEEMDTYFAGRREAHGVMVIDNISMELVDDETARVLGLHLIRELIEVDGIREAEIDLSEDRGIFRIDVTGDGHDQDRSVVDLYEDVRRACTDAGCGPDAITYVSSWGSPGGYLKDSAMCDCADGGLSRGTGMRHELLIYERYADRYDIVEVALEPGTVGLTIDDDITAARAQARRDTIPGAIEITIERANTEPP